MSSLDVVLTNYLQMVSNDREGLYIEAPGSLSLESPVYTPRYPKQQDDRTFVEEMLSLIIV